MSLTFTAIVERFAAAGKFVIARGQNTHIDAGRRGSVRRAYRHGRTAIYYDGKTAERCLEIAVTVHLTVLSSYAT
jgi:hypothetical protein